MSNKQKVKLKGFTLIEVLIVLVIFSMLVSSVGVFAIDSYRITESHNQRIRSMLKIEETINSLRAIKNDYWLEILNNANDGEKFLSFTNNQFIIGDGSQIIDGITYSFTISDVQRDTNGNIVESGGIVDLNTKAINLTASWTDNLEITSNYNSKIYLTNWNTKIWKETTESEFDTGTLDGSLVTTNNGGAVELDLEDTISADWCLPQLTTTYFNLPGWAFGQDIAAIENNIYMGTGIFASGTAFGHVSVTDEDPPVATSVGDFDGYTTSSVFGEDNYAYITTDDNSKEVVIIDLTTNPYSEEGYFNASGNSDGTDIFVQNNTGYLLQGSTLRTFDLTSKAGSRSQIGSFTLLGNGIAVSVRGHYAYVLINHSTTDMQILDISNPASMVQVATSSINNLAPVTALFVSEDGNRAVIGTSLSFFGKEVYLLNTSSKVGNQPTISSIEMSGMIVTDVALVEDNKRLIVGGIFGQEYKVYKLDTESNPVYCGGLNFNGGVSGIAPVVYEDSQNAYVYVISTVSSKELAVVRGGEIGGGGGGGGGSQYLEYGEYISSIFDSGSANTYYYLIQWDEQLFTNTDIQVQVRTGNTADLSGASWVGPDGTGSSYFTDGSGSYLPSIIQNKRYFQYRVELTSDKVETPILEEIHIEYQ